MSFIIFVSCLKCFSVRVRLSVSDIWSRSSFWITMHAYWVLMSAKQSIVYWGLTYLQTLIKVTFVANIGFIRSILLTQFERFYLWPRWRLNVSGISDCLLGYFTTLTISHTCLVLTWQSRCFEARQFHSEPPSVCYGGPFQPLPLCSSPPPAPPA